MFSQKVYTPDQVAQILQLSSATVYELIKRGEIVAKKLGKVYRVPAGSLAFAFSGLDEDLEMAQGEDMKNLPKINQALSRARKKMYD